MLQKSAASLRDRVTQDGFSIISHVIPASAVSRLREELAHNSLSRSRAGFRHALRHHAIADFVRDPALSSLGSEIFGADAIPFRATLFDKSPASNWLVVWHQDTALPIQHRRDVPGWGPWSSKDGITYAHAPAAALENILALRVHLDDSTIENGPLRVLPGTHSTGVLEDDSIHRLASEIEPVDCIVPLGGVIAMKPLIVHASSKSQSPQPRRVLHIEYAPSLHLQDGLKLALA
jgi:ectoine hydroxylase-related dioxygenase (phytanoyl-CoA dioxygenase family)